MTFPAWIVKLRRRAAQSEKEFEWTVVAATPDDARRSALAQLSLEHPRSFSNYEIIGEPKLKCLSEGQ